MEQNVHVNLAALHNFPFTMRNVCVSVQTLITKKIMFVTLVEEKVNVIIFAMTCKGFVVFIQLFYNQRSTPIPFQSN